MILIKLGGSVITDKSVPLSFSEDAVSAMGKAIRVVAESEPVILVHGGGSFGHYYSVRYDMHTKPAEYDLHGFSIVRNSMVRLNSMILDVLAQCELRPYCCPPSVLVYSNDAPYKTAPNGDSVADRFNVIPERVREIQTVSESGMCPVSYGDAMWHGDKMSYILSGDVIMSILADMLRPRLAVFAVDVDGLYASMDSKRLIRRVNPLQDESGAATFDATDDSELQKRDVTGGMVRKAHVATEISSKGIDVFFVNGNKPERIVDITHDKYEGTLFTL